MDVGIASYELVVISIKEVLYIWSGIPDVGGRNAAYIPNVGLYVYELLGRPERSEARDPELNWKTSKVQRRGETTQRWVGDGVISYAECRSKKSSGL